MKPDSSVFLTRWLRILQTWVDISLGREDPLETGMATHSSIPCLENFIDRAAWWATVQESQRVRHNWVTNIFSLSVEILPSLLWNMQATYFCCCCFLKAHFYWFKIHLLSKWLLVLLCSYSYKNDLFFFFAYILNLVFCEDEKLFMIL